MVISIIEFLTLLTGIILLLTLFEMIKQRKSSYKPDLVPVTTSLIIYSNKDGDYHWLNEELPEEHNIPTVFDDFEQIYHLNLYNIGLGAAKQVKYNLSFDMDELIKKIKLIDSKNEFKYEVIKGNTPQLKIEYQEKIIIIPVHKSVPMYDYALPTAVQKEPYAMHLSYVYQYLCSLLLKLYLVNSIREAIKFPVLRLTLDYIDIGNSVHKKLFIIEPQIGLLKLSKLETDRFEDICYVSFIPRYQSY